MSRKRYTEMEVINILEDLEFRFPPGFGLFMWSNILCLVRLDKNGGFSFVENNEAAQNAVVRMFKTIPADGGDP